jgi:hypothetical protein
MNEPGAHPNLRPGPRRPSLTRSASLRRVGLANSVRQGHARPLRHGVFALVANRPDIDVETALIFAAHPALDPVADRRIVEGLAIASTQHRRAVLAIEEAGTAGMRDSVLTHWEGRLAALSERLEQAVHARAIERARAASSGGSMVRQLQARHERPA